MSLPASIFYLLNEITGISPVIAALSVNFYQIEGISSYSNHSE